MSSRIAIIGSGIAGLATAFELRRRGHDVAVFEAESRPGGPVHTFERDGYLLETGPHSLLVRHKQVLTLIEALDLEADVIEANDSAKKRFVVRDGQPLALPMSPGQFFTTPLLSAAGRLRLLAEPFIGRFDNDDIDETLASFTSRRLGPEALAYLVDPFVGGIWAGDPRKLSARHTFPTLVEFEQSAGSIALGAIKSRLFSPNEDKVPRRLISFRGGMKTLIEALGEKLEDALRLDSPVCKLRRDERDWRVIYQRGKARRGDSFDAVISTIPAYALGNLEWENVEPPRDHIDELRRLPYAPCCVVSLGFHRSQVGHPLDGFGVLVPRVEEFHILGCLFVSSMFDGRAPKDHVLLTAFVGGARQPELTDDDDATVADMAHHDLGRLLDIDGEPRFESLTRWDRAIPQYEVGHGVHLDTLDRLEAQLPHVYFAGNYRDGIGMPDLIGSSVTHARRIHNDLTN